jgi:hypothetical protein
MWLERSNGPLEGNFTSQDSSANPRRVAAERGGVSPDSFWERNPPGSSKLSGLGKKSPGAGGRPSGGRATMLLNWPSCCAAQRDANKRATLGNDSLGGATS